MILEHWIGNDWHQVVPRTEVQKVRFAGSSMVCWFPSVWSILYRIWVDPVLRCRMLKTGERDLPWPVLISLSSGRPASTLQGLWLWRHRGWQLAGKPLGKSSGDWQKSALRLFISVWIFESRTLNINDRRIGSPCKKLSGLWKQIYGARYLWSTKKMDVISMLNFNLINCSFYRYNINK